MISLSGIPIPERRRSYYRKARLFAYGIFLFIVGNFLLEVLFPTFVFPFNFRTPGSLKNTLTDPRTDAGTPLESGKIEPSGLLIANASAFGRFSHAEIRATLEKNSPVPENLEIALRRSYRSFLLPPGEPITGFPAGSRFRIGDTYYELRENVLSPFVSEAAFLSRYPLSLAERAGPELLERFPVSERWLGYRPGSLLAFADGVFAVTSEEEVRPIGSADIFLRLGYRFEDVIAVSAEEVGIYRRGRIILLGAPHPDGTLFLDTVSGNYFLIQEGEKRPLPESEYRSFLLSRNGVITASSEDSEKISQCTALPTLSGRSLECRLSLESLAGNMGNDYEIRLSGTQAPVELSRLAVSLQSEKSLTSARRLLTQIKVRFLIRFGYENAQ